MRDLTRTKRLIYLALGIILLGVIAFLIYRSLAPAARRAPEQEERVRGRIPFLPFLPGGEEQTPEEARPGAAVAIPPEERKLIQLTDFAVISPSLNAKEDKILFYKKEGGDLMASSFIGDVQEKISNLTIVGLIEAIWSPARDRAAVFYLDDETVKGFLHVGTSGVAVLPQKIRSFSWSPDGRSLAYLIPQGDAVALVTADPSGRNQRTIFSTPVRDSRITWISADRIMFATAPSGLAEGFLFIFSRATALFSRLLGPLPGLSALSSPNGTRLLVAATNAAGRNLALSVRDASGKELLRPGFATLPEKCLWASAKELLCAVPREIPAGTVIPDDYLRGELNSEDQIVLLNTETRELQELFNEERFDMANLLLARDRGYLFFVNRADGTLWSLKLK